MNRAAKVAGTQERDDLERREQLRDRLPSDVLALMDEVEAFAGFPIPVAPMPPSASAAASAGVHPFPDHPCIFVRDPASVPAAAALHELLHLRRYWMEGVPLLVGSTGFELAACQWESAFEHLIVVPQQAAFGLREEAFWNGASKLVWDAHPWPRLPSYACVRLVALLEWVSSTLVTDPAVLAQGRRILEAMRLLEKADALKAGVQDRLHSKAHLLHFALQSLDLPATRFGLAHVEIRNREIILQPF